MVLMYISEGVDIVCFHILILIIIFNLYSIVDNKNLNCFPMTYSLVRIWSHRYFNFCVYNSKFVIYYWPTMVWATLSFQNPFFCVFKKVDKHFNSSHLDCADVIKRIWHQRLELWEPLGVLVPCKLVNDI